MKKTFLLYAVVISLWGTAYAAEDDMFKNLDKWLEMTPEQQREVIRKYHKYEQLSPEEKKLLEKRYHKYRNLPPDKKIILKKRFRKYQELTPEERSLLDMIKKNTKSPPQQRIDQR